MKKLGAGIRPFAIGRLPAIALISIAAAVNSAQAQTLDVPARSVPVPGTVSPQLAKIIGAPLRTNWNVLPKTGEEWKPVAEAGAAATMKNIPGMMERLHVKVEKTTIDGVRAFIVTPDEIAPQNRNRLLIHVHGGCYVLNPGEAALPEALFMAGFGHFKVIAVDYRMPPEAYFPAALDDGLTVYKNALKSNDPKNVAIFGSSAGGALTLEMVLKAKQDGLPLPGAIAPGTPMSDVTKVGDTFVTNAMLDNVLVSPDGFCDAATKVYANGPTAVADLRRYERLSAHYPHQRHARPVAQQHRSRSPQAPAGRGRRRVAGLRRPVPRALLSRRHRAGIQRGVRGDRRILRQASGEIGFNRLVAMEPTGGIDAQDD